jgi:NADH-quinone oxidoreductase subunit L
MNAHGHGDPHESPWLMLAPLCLLAVLSICGGWIGVGGRFERFLEPVMRPPQVETAARFETSAVADEQQRKMIAMMQAAQSDEAGQMPAGESKHENEHSKSTEEALMFTSVVIALAGLALAYFLYVKRRDLPAKVATSLNGLYTTVLNKYYVDEIYGAAIIRPIIQFSTSALWKGVDVGLIDGAVNGGAHATQDASEVLRQQQSGSIRSYAAWVAAGAGFVVLYMIWTGIR